jgi:hypothetical protein
MSTEKPSPPGEKQTAGASDKVTLSLSKVVIGDSRKMFPAAPENFSNPKFF